MQRYRAAEGSSAHGPGTDVGGITCMQAVQDVGAFGFSGCRPARANGWRVDGSVGLLVIGWDGVWVGDEFLRHEAGP